MSYEERMKMREEMRRKMMDSLLGGRGTDDPEALMRSMDHLMDRLVGDALDDIQSMASPGSMPDYGFKISGVQMEWSESKEGRILTLKPQDQQTKVDVQVLNGVITVKADKNTKQAQSQITRTQLVPGDCDGNKVKIEGKDGTIVLLFPWTKSSPTRPQERTPVKSKGEAEV